MIKQSVDKGSYKIAFAALIVIAVVITGVVYSISPTIFRSSPRLLDIHQSTRHAVGYFLGNDQRYMSGEIRSP